MNGMRADHVITIQATGLKNPSTTTFTLFGHQARKACVLFMPRPKPAPYFALSGHKHPLIGLLSKVKYAYSGLALNE